MNRLLRKNHLTTILIIFASLSLQAQEKADSHLHVDAVTQDGTTVSPLSGAYGTVSNEDFFTKFNGDYKKLLEFKQNGLKDNKILKADDTKMEARPNNTRVGSGYGF